MADDVSPEDPFPRSRIRVKGHEMASVDVGQGPPILFLHGNPTSSYLWRNVIPHVQHLGRCLAPDLIGMGDSDKLPDPGPGTYAFETHAAYLEAFLEAVDLAGPVTLVLHDWGSALGFDWAVRHPERVVGIAFMEAILTPVPSWEAFEPQRRELFQRLRTPGAGEAMILEQNVFVEKILPASVARGLGPEEMAHYRAPFRDPASRRPTLAWPREIPIEGTPADVTEIVTRSREALCRSPLPKLLLTVNPGVLVRAPLVAWCRANLPNLEVVELGRGFHFVQEDHPHVIGEQVAAWMRRHGLVASPR